MQEASTLISRARLNDLVNSISEARQSLQNWQDQKTEAMIRLDSFSYDIQRIEEEKTSLLERCESIKKEADAQNKIYQSQVNDLTDQLQMMKLEIEGLKNQGVQKDLLNDSLNKEVENQKRIKDQINAFHEKKVLELEDAFKKRHENTIAEEKRIQEALSAQIGDLTQRNAEAEAKIENLGRDINHIRSHMLTLLQPNPIHAPILRKDKSAPNLETQTISAMPNAEIATVDDYLKRLGY